MHVDQFIDSGLRGNFYSEDPMERYARFFFHLARLPATYQTQFQEAAGNPELYCDYESKRYRVTGASRMGDIWLAEDFNRVAGYDIPVDLVFCSNWGKQP